MTKRALYTTFLAALLLATAGLACNLTGPPTPAPTLAVTAAPADVLQVTPALPPTPAMPVEGEAADAVQAAIYALAVYLGRDPRGLGLVSATRTEFGDAALGCPRPGEQPAAEPTPGYTVVLSDGEQQYELHTSLDGLRVRCLHEDLRPADAPVPGTAGIMATIQALQNREYGTLASLLPPTVFLSTYPGAEQALAASGFVAQLRDIWLGPGSMQVDLNTNVLALMPSLQLPPNHIPVYSTGWGATRDTDGILFFDVSHQPPVLSRLQFVPAGQKAAAYAAATPGPGDESTETLTYQGNGYTIAFPDGWFTSTVGSLASFQPAGEGVAVVVEPWPATNPRREGQTFRSWIEAAVPGLVADFDALQTLAPLWAASGQPGYLVTWSRHRLDGALELSDPVALFEYPLVDEVNEFPALSVSLLNAERLPEFQQMVESLTIPPPAGVPGDMYIYRHDELGYRIQFPADWKLLPSPLGAAFQSPDEEIAMSIGPWPLASGPAAGQTFEDWVARAPAEGIPGYGPAVEIRPVSTTGGQTGYLARWQINQAGGTFGTSDPAAIFPLNRLHGDPPRAYYALAVSLHVPTYTVAFERMIATVVVEQLETAEMVFVPAGPFVRGSNEGQIAAWTAACGGGCRNDEFLDEAPQRTINLSSFFIDRTEVTVEQFKEFVAATGYQTTAERKGDPIQYTWRQFDAPDRQDHPVRWMSWDDASAYCQWAGKRLPTEAEWEKAARGADGRSWPWGNEWDDGRVPHNNASAVASYPNGASPYGALGMAGNVWEWVADWYSANYYGAAPDSDPAGPAQTSDKVLRGGGFNNANWAMRTSHRHLGGPQGYSSDHGFRCAADG